MKSSIKVFLSIIAIIAALLLCGCRSIQYVPVETVKKEYVSKTDTFVKRDSIYKRDSVMVTVKGDTVFVNRWNVTYKDRWRERIKTDTVFRTDSIRVPYPVEKKLTMWESLKIKAGGFIFVLFVLAIILYLSRLLVRKF
jgi:hypothetical protein